jgi:hypothetical protein
VVYPDDFASDNAAFAQIIYNVLTIPIINQQFVYRMDCFYRLSKIAFASEIIGFLFTKSRTKNFYRFLILIFSSMHDQQVRKVVEIRGQLRHR